MSQTTLDWDSDIDESKVDASAEFDILPKLEIEAGHSKRVILKEVAPRYVEFKKPIKGNKGMFVIDCEYEGTKYSLACAKTLRFQLKVVMKKLGIESLKDLDVIIGVTIPKDGEFAGQRMYFAQIPEKE